MTYMDGGRQYIVVATGARGNAGELVALARRGMADPSGPLRSRLC